MSSCAIRTWDSARRSEFLESNAALGLLDECQTATLLHPEDFDVTGEVRTGSLIASAGL